MLATVETDFRRFPGLVRRYCRCDFVRRCTCGDPTPASGWTVERLARLRALMNEHGSVAIAAFLLGEPAQRCNIALNDLLGRTPAHALAVLEARARS